MNSYVVGCDGGGTKTAVEVRDSKGNHVKRLTFGALNLNGETQEKVRETIRQILDDLNQLPGGRQACKGICIGSAGISNPVARNTLLSAFKQGGYTGEIQLVGDHETALYGALESSCGMVLIAGTGSICFGRNEQGEIRRTGGWGSLIDDEGSGYAIGRDMLSAIVRAHDGRGSHTVLKDLVFETLKIQEIEQLIQYIYNNAYQKASIASLAPLIETALGQEDEAAWGIVHKACKELSLLVGPIARTLKLERGEIALLGSVLLQNESIASQLKALLQRDFKELVCIKPKNDAAVGASLMALHQYKRG